MTQLSILNEMRFNTNSVLAKIDHYMGADPMKNKFFNNVTGQGMTLAIAGILIGAGAIAASPAAATAATLAVGAVGATALLTGTGMAVFGKMWNLVRGPEIDRELQAKESLDSPVYAVNMNNEPVKMSTREFYGQLENKDFYTQYKGIVKPYLVEHRNSLQLDNDFMMAKPQNVREYLRDVQNIYDPYYLNKEEQAIGKVMAMDTKSKILNAIGKMRLNVFGNDKKNDNKFDM